MIVWLLLGIAVTPVVFVLILCSLIALIGGD